MNKTVTAVILSLGLTAVAQAQSPRDPFHEASQLESHRTHGKPTVRLPDSRDPFVMLGRAPKPTPPATPHTAQPPAPPPVAHVVADPVSLPTVHGIVESSKGNMALLVDANRTYLVAPGQQLGDFRVTAIDAKGVRLSYAGSSWTLPLTEQHRAHQ